MLKEVESIHFTTNNKRLEFFKKLPSHEQGFYLLKLSTKKQIHVLENLSTKQIHDIITYLDHDEITDILQLISKNKKETILKNLKEEIKSKVEFLLKFNPETAAGIMSLDYILTDIDMSFKQLKDAVQTHEKRTGKFPEILVEKKGNLIGEIKGHDLILKKENEKIKNHIKQVQTIHYNSSEKEIISTFKKNKHDKVVVLDENNAVLGIIYTDDVLKLMHKQQNKHVYSLAGVNEEEEINDGPLTKVKNRYKWLIIHLFTAFLAVGVISFFESTIQALVLLAFYMPVVAGMGGNAGTQTMAVVIRGLALKEIKLEHSKKLLINEFFAGAINGVINGVLVAIVATLWNQNAVLGLILFLAMIFNLIIAGLFGAIVPLIMEKLGKDPASSSITFITAATDIFGFLIFLGLATIFI
jgi:magnesium transporter